MSVKTHHPGQATWRSSIRPVRADGADRRRATTWTVAAALLALVAAVLGLLLDSVYGGEASTAAMLRAYDLVTAVLVAPALLVSILLSRNGPGRVQLVMVGLVAYLVYTYAYYLFGTGFNDLFLVHAAVLATAALALVLQLTGLDVMAFAGEVLSRGRTRGAAVVLGVLAVALGGMWAYFAVHNAVTGQVPAGSRLVETDTVVHLGMALDLVLLVPLYAAAAALMWRASPWGHVLGAIGVVAGLLHQVTYLVAMPFQVAAEIPGAVSYDAGEPVIVALYLAGAALLFGRSSTPRH